MKTYLVILIVSLTLPHIAIADETKFGERNGHDWQMDKTRKRSVFDQVIPSYPGKEDLIEAIVGVAKQEYITGIFDLAVYQAKASDSLSPKSDYILRIGRLTVDQARKGLDEFYSHYENMNILILDALHVVQLKVTGVDSETIDWWTRFYRASK